MDAKLRVSLFKNPLALHGFALKLRSCELVSLLNVPIALQGFRLKTLGCLFSMFPSFYSLLPMPATDIFPFKRVLTVAHIGKEDPQPCNSDYQGILRSSYIPIIPLFFRAGGPPNR